MLKYFQKINLSLLVEKSGVFNHFTFIMLGNLEFCVNNIIYVKNKPVGRTLYVLYNCMVEVWY